MPTPRKPVELHVMDGTHRTDRHGPASVAPADEYVATLPDPTPKGCLGPVGLKEWRSQGQKAIAQKILTNADLVLLRLYCEIFEEVEALKALIRRRCEKLYDGELMLDDPEIVKADDKINRKRPQMAYYLKELATGPLQRAAANVGRPGNANSPKVPRRPKAS